jgi:hypothetical protein
VHELPELSNVQIEGNYFASQAEIIVDERVMRHESVMLKTSKSDFVN